MKRILSLLLLLVAVVGQTEARENGFGLGVTIPFSLTNDDWSYNYVDVTVVADYCWNFASIVSVSPEVGLYYERNKKIDVPCGIPITNMPDGSNECGFRVGVTVARNMFGALDLLTGPYLRYSITDIYAHRAGMMWSFGLGYSFWKMYAKATFDLHVTNQYDYNTKNAVALSLRYCF